MFPSLVVAVGAEKATSLPSIAAFVPDAAAKESVCHSWFVIDAFAFAIADMNGVSVGDMLYITFDKSSLSPTAS
jgi:hypothetical protein